LKKEDKTKKWKISSTIAHYFIEKAFNCCILTIKHLNCGMLYYMVMVCCWQIVVVYYFFDEGWSKNILLVKKS